jgi:hypothetical protein
MARRGYVIVNYSDYESEVSDDNTDDDTTTTTPPMNEALLPPPLSKKIPQVPVM